MSGAALLVVGLGVMVFGATGVSVATDLAVGRASAAGAADLAALAAASELSRSGDATAACGAAASVATANDAVLSGCDPDGVDVVVVGTVRRATFGVRYELSALARAGPG